MTIESHGAESCRARGCTVAIFEMPDGRAVDIRESCFADWRARHERAPVPIAIADVLRNSMNGDDWGVHSEIQEPERLAGAKRRCGG